MIAYMNGILKAKNKDEIIVETSGVGYVINIPLSTFEKLPQIDEKVKIYICESTGLYGGQTTLYGFLTSEEKEVFLLLKSISNVGAKQALDILSKIAGQKPGFSLFKKAIQQRDLRTLTSMFDFTKKTAEKLILHLKDKLAEAGVSDLTSGTHLKEQDLKEINDAIAGLVALGYTQTQAKEAVQQACDVVKEYKASDLIKQALRFL